MDCACLRSASHLESASSAMSATQDRRRSKACALAFVVLLLHASAGLAQDDPKIRADRKSTRLNSSHMSISYAVFCLKKKKKKNTNHNCKKKKKKRQNETN